MIFPDTPKSSEVDDLLRNAQLRDALEPLYDESIGRVNAELMSTSSENDFLQSMLEWERAPILPIYQWFQPELTLPAPDTLSESHLQEKLYQTIDQLYEKRIVLDFTDHLSDRELYCLIYRDILPTHEKLIRRQHKLFALGLREYGRRSRHLAALLCQRSGPTSLGGRDRRLSPASRSAALSARAATGTSLSKPLDLVVNALGAFESLRQIHESSRANSF